MSSPIHIFRARRVAAVAALPDRHGSVCHQRQGDPRPPGSQIRFRCPAWIPRVDVLAADCPGEGGRMLPWACLPAGRLCCICPLGDTKPQCTLPPSPSPIFPYSFLYDVVIGAFAAVLVRQLSFAGRCCCPGLQLCTGVAHADGEAATQPRTQNAVRCRNRGLMPTGRSHLC